MVSRVGIVSAFKLVELLTGYTCVFSCHLFQVTSKKAPLFLDCVDMGIKPLDGKLDKQIFIKFDELFIYFSFCGSVVRQHENEMKVTSNSSE